MILSEIPYCTGSTQCQINTPYFCTSTYILVPTSHYGRYLHILVTPPSLSTLFALSVNRLFTTHLCALHIGRGRAYSNALGKPAFPPALAYVTGRVPFRFSVSKRHLKKCGGKNVKWMVPSSETAVESCRLQLLVNRRRALWTRMCNAPASLKNISKQKHT